jgi:adenylosuccinate synthase
VTPITILQGGQYGSEAKGAVAGAMALKKTFQAAVRTGAINAGHTVYYNGKPYKMQQLPVAWVNPKTLLYIGPGAYIHFDTLDREIKMINAAMPGADVRDRILVDYRCTLHTLADETDAKKAGRHTLIGATGKGCAESIVSKIKDRGLIDIKAKDLLNKHNIMTGDVPHQLSFLIGQGAEIMVEGTQGSLLDLHQGPWPYTTSRMTTAANWVAEAGLPITMPYNLVMVMRTMPIRVAGNSGPLPNETTWPYVMRSINVRLDKFGLDAMVNESSICLYEDLLLEAAAPAFRPHCLNPQHLSAVKREKFKVDLSYCYSDALIKMERDHPEAFADITKVLELTTVTKKPRRIALWDWNTSRDVIRKERPTSVVLTFLNYLYPEIWGATGFYDMYKYGSRAAEYVRDMEEALGVRVSGVTTGPLPEHVLWKEDEDRLTGGK